MAKTKGKGINALITPQKGKKRASGASVGSLQDYCEASLKQKKEEFDKCFRKSSCLKPDDDDYNAQRLLCYRIWTEAFWEGVNWERATERKIKEITKEAEDGK